MPEYVVYVLFYFFFAIVFLARAKQIYIFKVNTFDIIERRIKSEVNTVILSQNLPVCVKIKLIDSIDAKKIFDKIKKVSIFKNIFTCLYDDKVYNKFFKELEIFIQTRERVENVYSTFSLLSKDNYNINR
jgi:hypothetical protein